MRREEDWTAMDLTPDMMRAISRGLWTGPDLTVISLRGRSGELWYSKSPPNLLLQPNIWTIEERQE